MHIETPGERSSELVAALADVWERSVRATHDFLAEDDIVGLRPEAESGIAGVERLTVAYDGGAPCGFAGSQDGKLEMLFVAPEARGRGVGRALLAHAVEHAGVRTLDVNEQNPQAVGFYEHEGFVVAGRSRSSRAGIRRSLRALCCILPGGGFSSSPARRSLAAGGTARASPASWAPPCWASRERRCSWRASRACCPPDRSPSSSAAWPPAASRCTPCC